MKSTKAIGDAGEDLAVDFLINNGHKVISRNYRTRSGEIDIIAMKLGCLIFVEVKRKSSVRFGLPAEMITPKKLSKIKKTAEFYIADSGYRGPWRIDVVSILGERVDLITNVTS